MVSTPKSPTIELGLHLLTTEKIDWIRGKSIGLITNHTGVDAVLRNNYKLLAEVPTCRLSAIFSPEHGFWGAVQDGIAVNSLSISEAQPTQVPVYSLYGESTRPTPSQLEGIDLLIYDMQDVGVRYYTYISTLLHAMEAAAELGLEFIVADRPNPIGCEAVEGPILTETFRSFVGIHEVPIRYGLTIGELAMLLKAERVPTCRLKVARMHGYERRMWYDDTGLQWVPPSPNMPTLTTATLYPGLCLFEGTNMSEGRGTTNPFEYIGAPWCDGERWAEELNARNLPGVLFRPVIFTPAPASKTTKHANTACSGVALHITDRQHFLPIETVIHMLSTLREAHADDFVFLPAHFDRLAGNDWLRQMLSDKTAVDKIQTQWCEALDTWYDRTAEYRFYA